MWGLRYRHERAFPHSRTTGPFGCSHWRAPCQRCLLRWNGEPSSGGARCIARTLHPPLRHLAFYLQARVAATAASTHSCIRQHPSPEHNSISPTPTLHHDWSLLPGRQCCLPRGYSVARLMCALPLTHTPSPCRRSPWSVRLAFSPRRARCGPGIFCFRWTLDF